MTNHPAPEGTALLKPAEAGVELRLSKATVYRLINSGDIAVTYVGHGKGRAARISRDALAAYIKNQTRKSSAA